MLAPWKKSCDKPRQHIKKQRHYFVDTVHLVKAKVFPGVMYRCESWIIKKAEHQRTDIFKWWCWRRILRVPWSARRSNQSILKKINSEYSLVGVMLKLQYFGHLMWTADSLENVLMMEKTEGDNRGWDGWMTSLTQWKWVWVTPDDSEGQRSLACCSSLSCKESYLT